MSQNVQMRDKLNYLSRCSLSEYSTSWTSTMSRAVEDPNGQRVTGSRPLHCTPEPLCDFSKTRPSNLKPWRIEESVRTMAQLSAVAFISHDSMKTSGQFTCWTVNAWPKKNIQIKLTAYDLGRTAERLYHKDCSRIRLLIQTRSASSVGIL